MRFLTDETVAASTIAMLRELGHDAIDVREVGLGGHADEDVMALAHAEHRVVVTHDKDFGDLLRFSPASHGGAVVLRLKDPRPLVTNLVLSGFLGRIAPDYLPGRLVILSERGFRSRPLGLD